MFAPFGTPLVVQWHSLTILILIIVIIHDLRSAGSCSKMMKISVMPMMRMMIVDDYLPMFALELIIVMIHDRATMFALVWQCLDYIII